MYIYGVLWSLPPTCLGHTPAAVLLLLMHVCVTVHCCHRIGLLLVVLLVMSQYWSLL